MTSTYTAISKKAQTDPESFVKITFDMTSTIGAHSEVDQIELSAFKLGLRCERKSTTGWFERSHVFRVEGRADKMKLFVQNYPALW